jgi:regulator of replication initiation timing
MADTIEEKYKNLKMEYDALETHYNRIFEELNQQKTNILEVMNENAQLRVKCKYQEEQLMVQLPARMEDQARIALLQAAKNVVSLLDQNM